MNTLYFIVGIILVLMLFYFSLKRNNTNQKVIQPKMPTKNKWLYTTDSFGKMEKGVVHDQVTYKRETMVHKRHSAYPTKRSSL